MLYLHEVIDIIGTGQGAYMKTVVERARHSQAEGISRLVGCWKVIGSTNRWPRVINLWEMDGWGHWAQTLERQFLPERKDPALAPWWTQAAQWRTGGFDRILEPASYSPTRAQLQQSGLRAWVCIQTIARTAPGRSAEYLERVGTQVLPALAAQGIALLGAYKAPMRSDEVVVIWAAADFAKACELFEGRDRVPELRSWSEVEADLQVRSETMWLVPDEECFFHP
jgi:hypothetical protein